MSRQLPEGIVPAFCDYCYETEIPSFYALWCGIFGVAAALGRRGSINFGYKTIYPNLFLVLVAESGRCRKSSGIVEINKMLWEVRPKINLLSQKMTPEALIDSLSTNKLKDDKVVIDAEGVAIADELTTLIDKNSVKTGLTNLMTNLYDCGDFSYRTRGRGIEEIRNPCFGLLGGTTVWWIKEALNVSSITGGFTARMIFAHLDNRERNVIWPELSLSNIERRKKIIHDLGEVAQSVGPFLVPPLTKKFFGEEYERFERGSELLKNPLTSGYANKRHVTLLKVAMAVSASRGDDRIINEQDLEVSLKALEAVEVSLPRVVRAISMSDVGDLCEFVFNIIQQKGVIDRGELIKAVRHKITASQLDDIMVGLHEQGVIAKDVRDGRIVYIYSERTKNGI